MGLNLNGSERSSIGEFSGKSTDSFVFSLPMLDSKFQWSVTGPVAEKMSPVITTAEEPIYVHIANDTDYPSIVTSIAGVVVAFFVGFYTVRSNKNQVQANISNLRHAWMAELRDCSAELFQRMHTLANHLEQVEDFSGGEKFVAEVERISILVSKLRLLLSRDDDDVRAIMQLVDQIIADLMALEFEQDCDPILRKLDRLTDLLRKELEDAWSDIKQDLGRVKKRFWLF